MSEYIISTAQLMIAAKSNNVVIPDKITGVEIRGDKLQEIVRCRDCKHSESVEGMHGGESIACGFDDATVEPDGFCAWGERREQ